MLYILSGLLILCILIIVYQRKINKTKSLYINLLTRTIETSYQTIYKSYINIQEADLSGAFIVDDKVGRSFNFIKLSIFKLFEDINILFGLDKFDYKTLEKIQNERINIQDKLENEYTTKEYIDDIQKELENNKEGLNSINRILNEKEKK